MTTPTPPDVSALTIAVLGGTGPQGRGLAWRFALAGNSVVLGSRAAEKAVEAAAGLTADLGSAAAGPGAGAITGADNAGAAQRGDVVIVAVPYDGHHELLLGLAPQLKGKIVIDCVNPLGFDRHGAFALPVQEGSAAQQAAAALPDSAVVGAFHHLSAVMLLDQDVASVDADVLVLGDDRTATDTVQALADRIPGMRGIYAGRLRNTAQVEALTANLISVNRRYQAHAGLRVTDV